MEMKDEVRYLLKPLNTTTRGFYAFIAVLVAVIGVAGYAWYVQLTQGLGVTGMNDTTIWGLYISNFIFFIGISHAGIAISAAVRLASLDKYKPIMRIAEALTLASLLMAAFSIVMDMGRPDRSFMLIKHYLERIGQSPLLWDVTAVSTYLVLSVTYLYFSLREDMAILKDEVGGWRGKIYKFLLPWHEEGEQETISRVAWWMAVCILPIMVMVHTTVAWIFSLLPNRPLWFGAVAGPYVRGDLGTIRKHLDALRTQAPEMLPAYCHLALTALPFALEKGNVPEERAAKARDLLEAALDSASGPGTGK